MRVMDLMLMITIHKAKCQSSYIVLQRLPSLSVHSMNGMIEQHHVTSLQHHHRPTIHRDGKVVRDADNGIVFVEEVGELTCLHIALTKHRERTMEN
mmetsp:Transcript_14075/g.34085  ORF Transcript_14075/g.34085 Transcript_14075/m.34085 type:complete len:96 (+) Transcript_14075:1033-1320(+)